MQIRITVNNLNKRQKLETGLDLTPTGRYTWCIFEDSQFEDLVSLAHLAGKTLEEEGFSDQLLSAVFAFKERGRVITHTSARPLMKG